MNEKEILEFLSKETYRPLRLRELAKEMSVPDERYGTFRRTVRSLLHQGAMVKLRRNRLGLPEKLNLTAGKLSVNPHGFGFVRPDDSSSDVYIQPQDMGTALDGDRVLVRLTSRMGKSPEGHIIKILERKRTTLVGTFKQGKHFYFVEPDDKHIHRDIYIAKENSAGAKLGQKVVVSLESWRDSYLNPEGKVLEVLGHAGQPGVDILSLVKDYNLPLDFPAEVLSEAKTIPGQISKSEIRKRLDLRAKVCFTIDPMDARDFDDAVSLEKLPNGNWLLGVHIADVSFYVRENSDLDREALERGNSIYLVDRVIPMLPHDLSNNVCSLNPNEDRLTFSCMLELDSEAKVMKYELRKSIIRSKARLNYNEVQELFDGKIRSGKPESLKNPLKDMLALSQKLLKKRLDKGSLDFDLPEAKVVLDKNGNILDIYEALRLDSHRLIEEFMLLANRTVAEHIFSLGIPFLYRVHEKPDEEKLESFANVVRHLGYDFKLDGRITPKKIQRFLSVVEEKPEGKWINHLLLRSLKKACYQPEDVGHFGLAFRHYTHFTSPIRRYADLMVHRILKWVEEDGYDAKKFKGLKEKLGVIGKQVSERERLAEEVERESVRLKQIEYLEGKLGEIYQGIITGFVSFGFFVQLNKLLIEGMVRLSSLEDDYYNYDEKRGCLVGKHTGKMYTLGQLIEVQVVRADKAQKQVDLVLTGEKEKSRKPKRRIRGFEWKRKMKS